MFFLRTGSAGVWTPVRNVIRESTAKARVIFCVSVPSGYFGPVRSRFMLSFACFFFFQMFPAYCRELGSGLSTCFGFIMFYAVIQISPYLLSDFGTSMTFYTFGGVSGIGAIFLYLCLPETKNKTMNDAT